MTSTSTSRYVCKRSRCCCTAPVFVRVCHYDDYCYGYCYDYDYDYDYDDDDDDADYYCYYGDD